MLEKLGRAEASARFAEMQKVYEEAYEKAPVTPFTNAQEFGELLPLHLADREYTLLCAHSATGMAGFCYGYVAAPDEWLGDLHVELPDTLRSSRRMLALCELVVSPEYQKRGLGTHLHNSLISAMAPDFTALHVLQDNDPAWSVYRRLGYHRLGTVPAGSPDGPLFDVLVLEGQPAGPVGDFGWSPGPGRTQLAQEPSSWSLPWSPS